MSLMKSDRTKAPKSDRIAGYAITPGSGTKSRSEYVSNLETRYSKTIASRNISREMDTLFEK